MKEFTLLALTRPVAVCADAAGASLPWSKTGNRMADVRRSGAGACDLLQRMPLNRVRVR
ncbi:MAG: hypothetical protein ACFUZC_20300 [Chthoniobacteraceae bacterium]